ncbi:hypothetical protein E1B28_012398 [Marasmius oreades]|uniref:Uncharacterized protein n=1 Tax=Marasmius oreades TaxID=181124 RepID=A0A9P7UNX5_9AGAR|nr:uncharacterized protein E1B28_012398 [Marasmius oreades]KAG7088400.1 hypothetical protein E1B28_012398 [Marasmius oreades]
MDIRRRVPFKFATETENENDNLVFDEQEQEELIQQLREEHNKSIFWYEIGILGILALSGLLHLIYLINPSKDPLSFSIIDTNNARADIPLPRFFSLLNIFLHASLLFYLSPGSLPQQFRPNDSSFPLPFLPLSLTHMYTLSLVAPVMCVVLQTSYTTFFWWCETSLVIYVVQVVREAISLGDEGIERLENMKYRAPGA